MIDGRILTEGGAFLTTESGVRLVTEDFVPRPDAAIPGASPSVLRRALRQYENDQIIAQQVAAREAARLAQQEDDEEAAVTLLLAA